MRKIAEASGREMKWAQHSALHMRYELAGPDGPIGGLEFENLLGSRATGESGDGTWTFKRVGFWQQKASVRKAGADSDLAVFKNNTWIGGGTLEFSQGRSFRATTNFWKTKFAWETEAGEWLVRFDYGGVFRKHANVEVSYGAKSLPELPILVLFGWYLAVMLARDHS